MATEPYAQSLNRATQTKENEENKINYTDCVILTTQKCCRKILAGTELNSSAFSFR